MLNDYFGQTQIFYALRRHQNVCYGQIPGYLPPLIDKYPDISFRQIPGYLLLKDLKISALGDTEISASGSYSDICLKQVLLHLLWVATQIYAFVR